MSYSYVRRGPKLLGRIIPHWLWVSGGLSINVGRRNLRHQVGLILYSTRGALEAGKSEQTNRASQSSLDWMSCRFSNSVVLVCILFCFNT